MDLCEQTLFETHEQLKAKKISILELSRTILERIEKFGKEIGAFITVNFDQVIEQAQVLEKKYSKNPQNLKPLSGIPVAVKDIFLSKGIRTTCASKILGNYVPPYSSTALARLLNEECLLTGKLNMDEFAMGSSSETSFFGSVKNPWDFSRVPGGSSGGSAAAVAAGLCFASLGTDTGGSIRQPASLTGIVGLKPTYGRVSRYGVIAFASSLDQVGPMTKDVRDNAICLQSIAGHDPKDSTSANIPVPHYLDALKTDLKGLRLGMPKEYFQEGLEDDVKKALEKATHTLKDLGAEVIEIELPHTQYAVPTYYIIASAEASSNLARYDGVRYGRRQPDIMTLDELYEKSKTHGFGAEVKRRIMLGSYVLSAGYYDAYYLKAQKVRTLIRQDFLNALQKVDAIITPTSPTCAFKLGEKTSDPLQMYLSDIFTINVNLAGLPGISVPCGFSQENLPIGMQIIAGAFEEERLFHIAYAYEQACTWHKKRPLFS